MNQKLNFYKTIVTGSHYEIGKQKGEAVKKYDPNIVAWLKQVPELPEHKQKLSEFTREEAVKRCELLNQYSKGLGDEVYGMADGIGVEVHQLNRILYGYGNKQPGACTVVGVSRKASADGHAYMGESYEFGFEDELHFVIQRANDSYAHMGFSLMQVGRFDGINEKGLCVGITSLDFTVPSAGEKEGFSFPFVVRILLDTCATTKEAVAKLNTLPVCTNANIIIGDRNGDIINHEILTHENRCSIAARPANPYVFGMNHFLDAKHHEQFPAKRYFSYAREMFLKQLFESKGKVNKEELQQAFKNKLPNGLCCHAYTCYFGTLRSMFYDLENSKMYVCFGSPQDVSYTEMDLWEQPGQECDSMLVMPVEFHDEKVPDHFWEFV